MKKILAHVLTPVVTLSLATQAIAIDDAGPQPRSMTPMVIELVKPAIPPDPNSYIGGVYGKIARSAEVYLKDHNCSYPMDVTVEFKIGRSGVIVSNVSIRTYEMFPEPREPEPAESVAQAIVQAAAPFNPLPPEYPAILHLEPSREPESQDFGVSYTFHEPPQSIKSGARIEPVAGHTPLRCMPLPEPRRHARLLFKNHVEHIDYGDGDR